VKALSRASIIALVGLALGPASAAWAARFGVPTNLNAAGQVCTAVGTPAGCTAASADPPGWFVLERLDSGSQNGDVVHQIRFFVEVTGTALDVRVFDAGPSGARDLGRDVQVRYRLRDPDNGTIATATITADDAAWMKLWTLKMGGQTTFSMPRAACIRGMVMNHIVHHRGQLSVYLRMLDIPVPAIYGPSADEKP